MRPARLAQRLRLVCFSQGVEERVYCGLSRFSEPQQVATSTPGILANRTTYRGSQAGRAIRLRSLEREPQLAVRVAALVGLQSLQRQAADPNRRTDWPTHDWAYSWLTEYENQTDPEVEAAIGDDLGSFMHFRTESQIGLGWRLPGTSYRTSAAQHAIGSS